jgi:hypothetical protein
MALPGERLGQGEFSFWRGGFPLPTRLDFEHAPGEVEKDDVGRL